MAEDAELIRRREIRQRKILENSESRLKKISGKYSLPDNASFLLTSEICNSESSRTTKSPDLNDSLLDTLKSTRKQSSPKVRNEQTSLHATTQLQTDFFTGLPLNDNNSVSNGAIHRTNTSDSYAFPKKVSDAETRSFGRTRADSRRNSSCTQMMMETLQFPSLKCNILRPWIALAIGICAKFLFVMYNPFPFSQSLLFPYVLLELSLYIWMKLETQGTTRSAPPQSLLLGALLLCGVSSHIISTLNDLFGTMQYLIQDFAIYLFSFVMSHFLYENYII